MATRAPADSKDIAARIRAYFAAQPPATRKILTQLREAILASAPKAVEHFSYGIPGFKYEGAPLAWYAGWAKHTSMYPLTPAMKQVLDAANTDYAVAKGTVRFPLDETLPVALIKRMIRARVSEIRARA